MRVRVKNLLIIRIHKKKKKKMVDQIRLISHPSFSVFFTFIL